MVTKRPYIPAYDFMRVCRGVSCYHFGSSVNDTLWWCRGVSLWKIMGITISVLCIMHCAFHCKSGLIFRGISYICYEDNRQVISQHCGVWQDESVYFGKTMLIRKTDTYRFQRSKNLQKLNCWRCHNVVQDHCFRYQSNMRSPQCIKLPVCDSYKLQSYLATFTIYHRLLKLSLSDRLGARV